jgi:hypothetical protein
MVDTTPIKEGISIKSGVKALVSIRDFENTKINSLLQLNKIEADIEKISKTALATIKGRIDSEIVVKGTAFAHEINESAKTLCKILLAIRSKIEVRGRNNSSELWEKMHVQLEKLKIAYQNLDDFAYTFLQDSEIAAWKRNMNNFAILILPPIFSFIDSSKLELKIIESYSSDNLEKIIKTILKPIPSGFNLPESDNIESDFLVPLRNFETEFAKEKDLWATFLAILEK